jgi:hypothetical protein
MFSPNIAKEINKIIIRINLMNTIKNLFLFKYLKYMKNLYERRFKILFYKFLKLFTSFL